MLSVTLYKKPSEQIKRKRQRERERESELETERVKQIGLTIKYNLRNGDSHLRCHCQLTGHSN